MKEKKKYFSHDFGARHDKDLAGLIMEFKDRGYGIFQAVVEMLHEHGGYLDFGEKTYMSIAKDLYSDVLTVQHVIENCVHKYGLFKVAEDKFYSDRALRNIEAYEESVQQRRGAGLKSAEARKRIKEGLDKLDERDSTSVERPSTNRQRNPTNRNINRNRNKKLNTVSIVSKSKKPQQGETEVKIGSDQPSPAPALNGVVCYDAQEMILNDQAYLETMCMKHSISLEDAKTELEKYHLNESKKEQYPMGAKAAKSGYDLWLIRSKEFKQIDNGRTKSGGGNKKIVDPKKDGDKP